MKKTNFTKHASLWMLAVMLLCLATLFTVGASAEGTAQAQWGESATSELTGSGTLQEAFDAAAADSTIGYIKLMSDIDLVDGYVSAEGGSFTLDLNGKALLSESYVLYLGSAVDITITDSDPSEEKTGRIESTGEGSSAITVWAGDTSAINLTIESGIIKGTVSAIRTDANGNASGTTLTVLGGTLGSEYNAIYAHCVGVTISGGTLETTDRTIYWLSGLIDLSAHDDPTGISLTNATGADVALPSEKLLLPEGYVLYDANGDPVSSLKDRGFYTVDRVKTAITVEPAENGSVTLSPSEGRLVPGTVVTVTATPIEGYMVDTITVEGATYDPNTKSFTVGEADISVFATFKPLQAAWGVDADSLTHQGTLSEAFDAAKTDASITYIKLMNSVAVGEMGAYVSGGAFTLDLNGYTITGPTYTLYLEGTTMTLVDTSPEQSGRLESTGKNASAIKGNGDEAVTLTINGGTIQGGYSAIMFDLMGAESGAKLILNGGTLIGGYAVQLNSASAVIKGGTMQSEWADIEWQDGVLDLSAHPNAVGVVVWNQTGEEQVVGENILLPEGLAMHDENSDRVTTMEFVEKYKIDRLHQTVAVVPAENGSLTLSPSEGRLTQGTKVTVTATPDEGYLVDTVTVEGATYDPNTKSFTVGEEDISVFVTFKLHEADWGSSESNLTHSGTLEEALQAAKVEGILYIRLRRDVGVEYGSVIALTNETLTLDLYGHKVSSGDNYVLSVKNSAAITLVDTVGGGRLISFGCHAVYANTNGRITMKGGALEGDPAGIFWKNGVIDLTGYSDLDTLSIHNASGVDLHIPHGHLLLPDDQIPYVNGVPVNLVGESTVFMIGEEKYLLSVGEADGVDVILAHEDEWIRPNTTVAFALEMNALYRLIDVTATADSGEAILLSYDEETGEYRFVMPKEGVDIRIETEILPFVWGESADALTQKGTFRELVEAINKGEAPYAKLLVDTTFAPYEGLVISNRSVIDLGGYTLTQTSFAQSFSLADGADITFTDSFDVDSINVSSRVYVQFELQEGSKLTIRGTRLESSLLYNGGKLDLSQANRLTQFFLINVTDNDLTVAEAIALGSHFAPVDPMNFYANEEGTLIARVPVLKAGKGVNILAVYRIHFDLGEGSGTMPVVETTYGMSYSVPTLEDASHPNGLALLGWLSKNSERETLAQRDFVHDVLTDETLKAVWDAPLYVGGVAMKDGDYLASGATETTQERPVLGGYAYYKNGVLTLCNYTLDGEGYLYAYTIQEDDEQRYTAAIYSTNDIVIEIVGVNTLLFKNAFAYGEDDVFVTYADGILSHATLTIRGPGSLTVQSESVGIIARNVTVESGVLTLVSSNDCAVLVDEVFALNGGTVTVISTDTGIESDTVVITDGVLRVMPIDPSESFYAAIDTLTLTVKDGELDLEGEILALYVTIEGGTVTISADNGIEASQRGDPHSEKAPFIAISGGEVMMDVAYHGIYFHGDILITGGEIDISAGEIGICLNDESFQMSDGLAWIYGGTVGIVHQGNGDFTVSGGTLSVDSIGEIGLLLQATGKVTFSNAMVTVYAGIGMEATGEIIFENVNLYLSCTGEPLVAAKVTIKGGETMFCLEGEVDWDMLSYDTDEIALIVEQADCGYLEGVDVKHTWSENYESNETHHWHVCTDDTTCLLPMISRLFPSALAHYAEAAYGEHTIAEGEEFCSVCEDWKNAIPETPEDALIIAGNHYIKDGDYLTVDGKIVTEQPEGGYLHVTVEEDEWGVYGKILLNDFTLSYTGMAALNIAPTLERWVMELKGNNTLTALPQSFGDAIPITNGAGILVNGTHLTIGGGGSLTIQAEDGICIREGALILDEHVTVTIDAAHSGIVASAEELAMSHTLTVRQATLAIQAVEDGINANGMLLLFGEKSVVTIQAEEDDGIALDYGYLLLQGADVTILVDDEGLNLSDCMAMFDRSDVTIQAGDDAIDGDGGILQIQKSIVRLIADDLGITFADSSFFVVESTLTIVAVDDGLEAYDTELHIQDSTVHITSDDRGLDVWYGSESEDGEDVVVLGSDITIRSKRNDIGYLTALIGDSKLDITATDTALELIDATMTMEGVEAKIQATRYGVSGEGAELSVQDSALAIDAAVGGVEGYMTLSLLGELDVSIRAMTAVSVSLLEIDEEQYTINALATDDGFCDASGDYVSYVTVCSTGYAVEKVNEATEKLEQLLTEGGTIDAITDAIADVNTLLDTLTNTEGGGRLDLIEKANEAINKALGVLEANLEQAQKDLSDAIADGDTALDDKITNLNKALSDAEKAYAAADKTLDDKLTSAQTTLDNAIKAVDKKLDEAKSALDKAIADGDTALDEKITALNKALADAAAANETADGAIKTELSGKIEEANASLANAITAIQAQLDTAKTEMQASSSQGDQALRAEIASLKAELTAADKKASTWQTVTTVIAVVCLVCNAGLVALAVILEVKKKFLSSLFRKG